MQFSEFIRSSPVLTLIRAGILGLIVVTFTSIPLLVSYVLWKTYIPYEFTIAFGFFLSILVATGCIGSLVQMDLESIKTR